MSFWVIMLVTILLTPISMVGFGRYFIKSSGPKKINLLFGYRTAMSTKNNETWTFAHKYCGKLWWVMGWISFIVSVGAILAVIGKAKDIVGIVGNVLVVIQLAIIICSIIPTEIALRRNFDKDGNRKA